MLGFFFFAVKSSESEISQFCLPDKLSVGNSSLFPAKSIPPQARACRDMTVCELGEAYLTLRDGSSLAVALSSALSLTSACACTVSSFSSPIDLRFYADAFFISTAGILKTFK